MRHGGGPSFDLAKSLLSSLFFEVLGYLKTDWEIHLPSSSLHYQDESVRVRDVETTEVPWREEKGCREYGRRQRTGYLHSFYSFHSSSARSTAKDKQNNKRVTTYFLCYLKYYEHRN